MDMEKNLKRIKNIRETGLIYKGLNINSVELMDIINNITSSEEVWNFPEFVGKYSTAEFLNILADKKLYDTSLLSNFEAKFIQNIPTKLFKELNPKTLSSFTVEQFKNIDKSVIDDLLKNNKLQHLSSDILKEIDIDFSYKYSINIASNKPNFDVVKKQVESLQESKKLQFLSTKSLETIANDNYLIKIINDLNDFDGEQLKVIENNLANLSPEAINTLTPETLSKFKTLKNFTPHQLRYLNNKSLKYIINNNPNFNLEENAEVPSIISEKITNLTELNDKSKLNLSDISYSISEFLKKDSYNQMSVFCIELSKQNDKKALIKQVLKTKIAECKNNIYGNIDKIEMLKILTLIDSEENNNKNFTNLTNTIENLSGIEPRTIDGYFCRSRLYSRLILDNNFNLDYQEKLAEENLKNIENCIKNNYSLSERNSLDTPLKQLKAQALMEYSNILTKKYNINPNKFKNISEDNKKFLNKYESIYYNSVKEAIDLEPNIESVVKSWATPILKIATKSIITYLGTKATTGKVSTVVGTTGALLVVNDVRNEFNKKNYFMNPYNFHKEEKEREESFFDKIIRAKNNLVNAIVYPFKKITNFFTNKEDLKGFEKEKSNIPLNIQSTLYKKNMCRNSFEDILNLKKAEYNKNMNDLRNDLKQNNRTIMADLIEENNSLKREALEIRTQRKIENLYLQHPQFKDQGIFTGYFDRIKEAVKGTAKGILGSLFDIATLGVGSDIYNKFVDNEEETQKRIKNKIELEEFQKQVNIINNKFTNKLNEINQKECEQLASMNNEDKSSLNLFINNQQTEIESLQNYFGDIYKNCKIDDKIEQSLEFSDKTRKFDENIYKHLSINNQILDGIENLDGKNYDEKKYLEAKNQLLDLLQYGNVNEEILLKNSTKFESLILDKINEGQINPNEAKNYIEPVKYIMKNCNKQDIVSELVKSYDNQEEITQTKFVDKYLERKNAVEYNIQE